MKCYILTWDYKGQIDPKELDEAVSAVFDGINPPAVMGVDTESDSYGIIVSSQPIDSEIAKRVFWELYRGDSPLVRLPSPSSNKVSRPKENRR